MTRHDERFVELFDVTKAYPNPYGKAVTVVDRFSLIIRRGEVVSLIGHSGCGKSTVLTMVAGLNSISSGGVVVDGREIDGPGPDRAVVFQSPCLLPWMTAFDNVKLGVDRVFPHGSKNERRQICEYYLNAVGLADAMHRYPRELSGGMQQRVGIARAIALRPKMLLLDEPFGRLDSLTRMELQDVILQVLDREKITTMVITHDVDEAIYMSDRVCMMTSGPAARVGQVLELPFARPRERAAILEHPDYYEFRACLLDFLEGQDRRRRKVTDVSEPDWKKMSHQSESDNPDTVQDSSLAGVSQGRLAPRQSEFPEPELNLRHKRPGPPRNPRTLRSELTDHS